MWLCWIFRTESVNIVDMAGGGKFVNDVLKEG
jgi:hypothetical protein